MSAPAHTQGTVDMNIDDLVGKAREGDVEGEDPVDPIRFVATVSKVGHRAVAFAQCYMTHQYGYLAAVRPVNH